MVLSPLHHELGIYYTCRNILKVHVLKAYDAAICLASNIHNGNWNVGLLFLLVVLPLALGTKSKHRHGTYP